jgi:hypothetical protein
MDGYEFFGWLSEKNELWVVAGCRGPWTVARFREHVAKEYPKTSKAVETLQILDFIEQRFNATVTPPAKPAERKKKATQRTVKKTPVKKTAKRVAKKPVAKKGRK